MSFLRGQPAVLSRSSKQKKTGNRRPTSLACFPTGKRQRHTCYKTRSWMCRWSRRSICSSFTSPPRLQWFSLIEMAGWKKHGSGSSRQPVRRQYLMLSGNRVSSDRVSWRRGHSSRPGRRVSSLRSVIPCGGERAGTAPPTSNSRKKEKVK